MSSNASTIAEITIQFQLTPQLLSLTLGLALFTAGIIGNFFKAPI